MTVDRSRVDHREDGLVRIGLVDGLGPLGEPEDVEMGVVDGVLFVAPGRHLPEGHRVDDLASPERRLEHVAVPLAVGQAACADPRTAGDVPRTVPCLKRFVRSRVRQIHRAPRSYLAYTGLRT